MLNLDYATKLLSKLYVRDRDSNLPVRFVLKDNQMACIEAMKEQANAGKPIRLIVDKSRRVGVSAVTDALAVLYGTANPGTDARIIAHLDDSVTELFKVPTSIYNQFRTNWCHELPEANSNKLVIPHDGNLNSTLSIATAGSTQGGRGAGYAFLHLCLGGDSLINVGNGDLVKISELKLGDTVRTHTGALAKVSAISNRPVFTGEKIVTIRTWLNFETLTLTADHKVWTQRGWVKAGELTKQDFIGTPIRSFTGTKTQLELPHWENMRGKKLIGGTIPLDREFGFFVGYYLAEGSLGKNRWSAGLRSASITFAHHHKELAYAERACAAVASVSRSHRTNYDAGYRASTTLYGTTLATLIHQEFGTTDEKTIPEWIFDAPREFAEGLVTGYLAGDGSKDIASHGGYQCPTIYATSVRPRLLYQLRHIIAALGWGWGGMTYEKGFVDDRGWNNRESWTVSLNGHTGIKLREALGLDIPIDSESTTERRNRAKKYKLENGYVWTKVKEVTDTQADEVWDIEVAHEDHSFETVIGAVANSETAFYKSPEALTSLLSTVPYHPNTIVVIESTANGRVGIGKSFYDLWNSAERGESEYKPLFLSWLTDSFFRRDPAGASDAPIDEEEKDLIKYFGADKGQLAWRRWAIHNLCSGYLERFHQEYPTCVIGDTRISTEYGMIPIREAKPGMVTESGQLLNFAPNGVRDVYRLTTQMGYSVIGTEDHPVELEDGTFFNLGYCQGQTIKLRPPRFAFTYNIASSQLMHNAETTICIDEDWGRLLGYIMGDGSFEKGTLSICCDAKDTDVISDVERLLNKIIGSCSKRVVGNKQGGIEIRANSVLFAEMMKLLGIYRINTKPHRRVCVPECIWRSPKPVVKEFLSALFEADGFNGYKNGGGVRLFSKYRDFLVGVQQLLLGFGITSVIRSAPKRTATHTYTGNELQLRTAEAAEFHKHIGFISKRKQTNRPLSKAGSPRIPILFQDRVISIEYIGEEQVYDIATEQQVFSANGVSVHNCASESFVSSGDPAFGRPEMMAARQSIEKPQLGQLLVENGSVVFREGRGRLKLWEKPQSGDHYFIGVDCARGLVEGDFASITVLNGTTNEVAARYDERISPRPLARVVRDLAKWFNGALVIIELTGNLGLECQNELRDVLGYRKLYRRKGKDDKAGFAKQSNLAGWETNHRTRDQLLISFRESILTGDFKVKCETVVAQMDLAQRYAMDGFEVKFGHDDSLFSCLLANIACRQYPPPKIAGFKSPESDKKEEPLPRAKTVGDTIATTQMQMGNAHIRKILNYHKDAKAEALAKSRLEGV